MRTERIIGIVNLCVGLLCIILAIDSFRRMFAIIKWGADVDLAVIDSKYVRRDLTDFEKKEYADRRDQILIKYSIFQRDSFVAGRNTIALLILAGYLGLVGFILIRKPSKVAEPSAGGNAAPPHR